MTKEEIKQCEAKLTYYKDIRAKIREHINMGDLSATDYRVSSLRLSDLRLIYALEKAITETEKQLGK